MRVQNKCTGTTVFVGRLTSETERPHMRTLLTEHFTELLNNLNERGNSDAPAHLWPLTCLSGENWLLGDGLQKASSHSN